MRFSVKKTFSLESRKLFVIAGIPESVDLNGWSKILNLKLRLNMPINSIEAVNLSNDESLQGITISYANDDELELLQKLKEGDYILIE